MNERGPFTWIRLELPVPISPDAGRAALQSLAGLSGQPRVVLEAIGNNGRVTWRLGAERNALARVLSALRAHLPELRVAEHRAPSQRLSTAAALHAPGHRQRRLRTDEIEPVTRSLLAALAEARASEQVRLQLILGSRHRPRRIIDVEPRRRREVSAKFDEYRFGCSVRLGADGTTPARSRRLVSGVVAALRALEVPGVGLSMRRATISAIERAGSPFLWPLELSISDIVPLLGWPIASKPDAHLPGVPSRHPVQLPVPNQVRRSGLVLGSSQIDDTRPVALGQIDALRHLHILGPTGVGKSTLIANLALQVMARGQGAVIIDPKGDLVEDLLNRLPKDRRDDVVVIDPTDSMPVGLAALGTSSNQDADLVADTLLGVMHSLYADAWGPRTHDILHASLLTLARRGDASLPMIPLLLTNHGFRRSLTQTVVKADPMGLGSFWGWFDSLSDGEREHAIAPLMNKLRPILLRPGMRGVLGQRRPRFHLGEVFSHNKLLFVSLSKGVLGPEAAQLLGSLVVGLLWQTALERGSLPQSERRPVHVFIDEVQEYLRLPGDLGDALAQARGLGVGFILAHQHLKQLTPTVREAVLTNARSRVAFQLSPADARELCRPGGRVAPEDFLTLPAFHAYAQLLVAGATAEWCSLATPNLPPSSATSRPVRQRSRQLYGQPLDAIERDLLKLVAPETTANQAPLGRTPRRRPDSGGAS
ncbi:MAG: type IV secretion system DNA-binding domain-containing protein [Nocardioidaceae bacterium]|nr:type IV secretion system DNA-binding domain-containing protein [Nocardioidaceae bacterium]